MGRLVGAVGSIWGGAKFYWQFALKPFYACPNRGYRYRAYAYTLVVVALVLTNVFSSVLLSYELNRLGDAYQHGASSALYKDIAWWMCVYMVLFVATDPSVYAYILPRFGQHYQEALIEWYMPLWISKNPQIKHGAQRLKDCTKQISEVLPSFCTRVFRYLCGFIGFVIVAWEVSKQFTFLVDIILSALFAAYGFVWTTPLKWNYAHLVFGYNIPGILIWLTVIISIFEIWVCWLAGRRLPLLQQRFQEADAAVRSNYERMQRRLAKGKSVEPRIRGDKKLRAEWRRRRFRLLNNQVWLLIFQHTYGNFWGQGLRIALGTFVAVINLYPLGTLEQAVAISGEMHRSLSIFSDSWQTLASLQADVNRTSELETGIESS